MMNLELLFWAARNSSNATLHAMAESHANMTALHHVRADGSTFHVVDYNPASGAVARRCTAQGLRDNSTWSRGQAWCVYGFTMAYRFTRLPLHLATARRCADYFLSHAGAQGDPRDSVPLWDFAWPMPQTRRRQGRRLGHRAPPTRLRGARRFGRACAAETCSRRGDYCHAPTISRALYW